MPPPIGTSTAAAVFTAVLTQGPLSRAELASHLGLSAAAVTKSARPLTDAGYLVETASDPGARGIGRPATPLRIQADRCFFAGVKITADELIGVITDLRAEVRVTLHRPLPEQPEVGTVVAELAVLIGDLLATDPEFGRRMALLGVSISGDVDPETGIVRYSPFLGWRNVPFAAAVEQATGLTTVLDNDVRALTVAEQWFGSGVDASSFAVLTVGTGIGCGLFVNGRVVSGAHGVAGEVGHLSIDSTGPLCHCGGRGCVEAIASHSAILARIGEVTMGEAVALARSGDQRALAAFGEAGHAIGIALASVANLIGPERLIISGEGVAAFDLYEPRLRETFAVQAFGAAAEAELIIRELSFDDWARGAAAAAVRRFIVPDKK